MTALHALMLTRAAEKGWIVSWEIEGDGLRVEAPGMASDKALILDLADEVQVNAFCLGLAVAS